MTAGAESQHSVSALAVLSLRLSLMCVVYELARSATGFFIPASNITVVRSALENQVFLHVLFRYVRCKLGIISMGKKKSLMVVPLTSFKLTAEPAGHVEMHVFEIRMPHPKQHSVFPFPTQAMEGDGSQHLTDLRSVFPTFCPPNHHQAQDGAFIAGNGTVVITFVTLRGHFPQK